MLNDLSDEELINRIQKNEDKEAINLLLFRYEDEIKKVVRSRLSKIGKFYYDYEEFCQLIRFTTFKIIKTFDLSKGSFYNYWSSASNRMITTELRRMSRKISGLEVNQIFVLNEEEEDYMENLIKDEETLRREIDAHSELERIKTVSDEFLTFEEKIILSYKMVGYSYEEIAKKIKSTPKRVDNAMLQIRKKLKRYL